ncbi:hypothetical protein GWI33_007783 [Rhynchophorus ferrugineus]|uniref:Uncharacterized protein n=1 Tax=Rhynchophorus ferrugineus TaxID=354439 RepID=A0A834IJE4_RHYFE|nr:hypothetical protein GWI33_007783 [Rhynchophorus ferrugineus]
MGGEYKDSRVDTDLETNALSPSEKQHRTAAELEAHNGDDNNNNAPRQERTVLGRDKMPNNLSVQPCRAK